MPRFAAIRRNLATFGRAVLTVEGTGIAAAAATAGGRIGVDGISAAAVPQIGEITIPNEPSVFPTGAGTIGEAVIAITGSGRAATTGDPGFPYTFPFIFGGPLPVEGEATGTGVISLDGTSPAAAGAVAQSAVTIIGSGDTESGGFPYHFPFPLA